MLPSQEASAFPLCHGNSLGAAGMGDGEQRGNEQRPFVLESQLRRARLRAACFSHAFPRVTGEARCARCHAKITVLTLFISVVTQVRPSRQQLQPASGLPGIA